jgi:hypothetical protein
MQHSALIMQNSPHLFPVNPEIAFYPISKVSSFFPPYHPIDYRTNHLCGKFEKILKDK